jgi:hypothetical protein
MNEHEVSTQIALCNQKIDGLQGDIARQYDVLKELHDKMDKVILENSVTLAKHDTLITGMNDEIDYNHRELTGKIDSVDKKVNWGGGALFTIFITLLGAAAQLFLPSKGP